VETEGMNKLNVQRRRERENKEKALITCLYAKE
jgi:hypothetical protein